MSPIQGRCARRDVLTQHACFHSPWEYPGHTYIPLSIERECTKATVVPQEERKDQALVLAKLFSKSTSIDKISMTRR